MALEAPSFSKSCMCGRTNEIPAGATLAEPFLCACTRRYLVEAGAARRIAGEVRPALCVMIESTILRSRSGATTIQGPEDVELVPGIEELLWSYKQKGYLIFGLSSTSAVAEGTKTEEQAAEELSVMIHLFEAPPFDAIKVSHNYPDGTVPMFKHRSLMSVPNYGMLALCESDAADAGFIIAWHRSLIVGAESDEQRMAENAKIAFIHQAQFALRTPELLRAT